MLVPELAELHDATLYIIMGKQAWRGIYNEDLPKTLGSHLSHSQEVTKQFSLYTDIFCQSLSVHTPHTRHFSV
jgi:hypothetical protein